MLPIFVSDVKLYLSYSPMLPILTLNDLKQVRQKSTTVRYSIPV